MFSVQGKSVGRNTRSAGAPENENHQAEHQNEAARIVNTEEPILRLEKQKTSKKRKAEPKKPKEESEESDDECEIERSNRPASVNLRTRVGPAPFMKLIKLLDDNKKVAVERIGFGGLLHLNFDRFYGDLVEFLLKNFRPISGQLQLANGELLDIEDEDVKAVFGLPKGKIEVQEANAKNETEEYTQLLQEWREEWGIDKGSPQTSKMIEKIVADTDTGDRFIRNFVVFTVSCLIRGNQSVRSNFKILLSLVNVADIPKMNWCNYTRRSLMDAGEEWQANQSKMFSGPLLFLMICYFDRVQFKGQLLETAYPTIRIWDKERIDKRVKDERKVGFGLGKVTQRILTVEEDDEEKKGGKEDEENEDDEMLSKEDCVKKIIAVAQKFSDAFVEFSKLPSAISKRFPNSDILKKIYLTTADYFIRQGNGKEQATENERFSEKCTLEEDDDFFNEPGAMEALIKLEKAALLKLTMPSLDLGIVFTMTQPETNAVQKNQKQTDDQTTGEQIREIARTVEGENNEDDVTARVNEAGKINTPGVNQNDANEEIELGVAGDDKTAADGEAKKEVDNEEVNIELRVAGDDKTPADGEAKKEVDNNQGNYEVKAYRRKKLRNVNYRSPLLKNNRRLCKEMSREEKIVLDYGFSKVVEKECLYQDEGGLFITHEEFQTLEEQTVENSIIYAWAKIVNDREKSNNTTKRAFIASPLVYAQFDVTSGDPMENMVERLEKEVNEAGADVKQFDMIMFPIHKDLHYYIYCFYTKSNIVDVIDNHQLPDGVDFGDKYGESFTKMGEGFKIFCKKVKLSGAKATNWIPRILCMPWRHNGNKVDSGIFAMRHLETFRGEGHKWNSGFAPPTNEGIKAQSETLQKMRLMYGAQILLSKFNIEREKVVKKANDYIKM
ncbi:unnamed protein product [Cuscuta epithymum]|uniref:Ubiquitin-like protease family profile domain-containing protein n=1 Tax=Cuscuta epithymum TaxID=186058 RepID=A0AAV0FNA8_9ASTE|nr:unnamed protein product [Cuscuta epithymum]